MKTWCNMKKASSLKHGEETDKVSDVRSSVITSENVEQNDEDKVWRSPLRKRLAHGNDGGKRRRKRYDYEDTHDWNYDDKDVDYEDESDQKVKIKKLLLNWEKIALRLLFVISAILMVVCCCWFACRNFFKAVFTSCYSLCRTCCSLCLTICKPDHDPMYDQVSMFTERMGFKLDYESYKKLRDMSTDAALQSQGIDPEMRKKFQEGGINL